MKDVPGFEGLYAVTEDGRVWNHHLGKWIPPFYVTGYPAVGLKNSNGYRRKYLVHRLIALTYIPKPELVVNHRNGNKRDNRLENLEWLTTKENNWHAIRTDLVGHAQGERCASARLKDVDVLEMRRLREEERLTYKEIAARFKYDESNVSRIINRQLWKHIP